MLRSCAFLIIGLTSSVMCGWGAEQIYSGPQPGEKATKFEVLELATEGGLEERTVDPSGQARPVVLVFLHAIERSMVPLLRVIDEYAGSREEKLSSHFVFLSGDRISGEQRMKAVNGSLKLKSKVGLSPDGVEGPGNYGLNKECMMTVVVAKDGQVTHNFALAQPGIADGGEIIKALAMVSGDENPPAVETLAGARGNMAPDRPRNREKMAGQENFPGAVPTDPKLTGLLRQFIRPGNDEATVDRVLGEVKSYIKDDPDLKKQAVDGWTRVLHFGDRYGTPYAREEGAEFLKELKQE